ncbi:unnamed protein product [Clonostachys rosea f. rosea IK726]|uniref:Uncharacterized protein n=1 Tax=Clonostachys rosea f. rosea IK726 TaxID=1349383 RepID=A0ACA9ULR0_BIOOC|nr:unnamed protein product [Clonostachys rosea f. rosea IK726]
MNSYACGLCSRSFSQGPARDRHQLRCRSRPRSRKRACAACSRAKSRCDYSLPACHRCSTLSVQCIYPVQAQVIQISDHRPHQPTELSVETSPNAERGVSHPTSLVTLADVVGSTDHNLYESSTGAVPWWDYQNKNAAHLPTASVQPTPQSQDHITDRTEVALVSTEPFPPTNQGIFRTHPPIETTSTAFVDLSRLLAVQWTTAGQGLDLIESQLKQYPKFLINGVTKLPFIHWRHSSPPQRSETLATAIAMASLCASPEPHSTSLLLKSISMEVQHIYKKVKRPALKYPPAESLAAFQATLLYSIMRTICASASSVAMIDEKAVRIFQFYL